MMGAGFIVGGCLTARVGSNLSLNSAKYLVQVWRKDIENQCEI